MSSFSTAKATHIFFSKKFQHINVSLDVNFNESLTNDIVSFEQLGPDFDGFSLFDIKKRKSRSHGSRMNGNVKIHANLSELNDILK